MADVAGVGVAVDVGDPFEFGGVGVAGADVARLEGFELLLRAEFVGLGGGVSGGGGGGFKRGGGGEGRGNVPWLWWGVNGEWNGRFVVLVKMRGERLSQDFW